MQREAAPTCDQTGLTASIEHVLECIGSVHTPQRLARLFEKAITACREPLTQAVLLRLSRQENMAFSSEVTQLAKSAAPTTVSNLAVKPPPMGPCSARSLVAEKARTLSEEIRRAQAHVLYGVLLSRQVGLSARRLKAVATLHAEDRGKASLANSIGGSLPQSQLFVTAATRIDQERGQGRTIEEHRTSYMERAKATYVAASCISYRALRHVPGLQLLHSERQSRKAAVLEWHDKAREEALQKRVNALQSHNMTEYKQLVRSTQSGRLRELLDCTDNILRELMRRLGSAAAWATPGKGDIAAAGTDEHWALLAERLEVAIPAQPTILRAGSLHSFQMKGLQWMVALHDRGLNGILADEMGLGKTIQVIALIGYLIESRAVKAPFLIAAPPSVLENWEKELERWIPDVRCAISRGPAEVRAEIIDKVRSRGKPVQVLVTSHDFLMRDAACLSALHWHYMILDEGHRLKNAKCKLISALRTYTASHRMLLTATPIHNSLEELWSLLNFLAPTIFLAADNFHTWFSAPIQQLGIAQALTQEEELLVTNRLHQIIRPFLLRRLKQDVASELPDKVEKIIRCQMSPYQAALCSIVRTGAAAEQGLKGVSIANAVMELRNICNHPFISKLHVKGAELRLAQKALPAFVRLCSKMDVLDRILCKLYATKHRVLIFSTMTRALDVIEDLLDYRGWRFVRMDGSTPTAERGSLVDSFNSPGSPIFAFLLSVRTGGVGLNLQSADTAIMYDSDWNPQIDLQAQARIHRLGQTRQVLILRLQTEHSIEEKVWQNAEEKRRVADKSISAGLFDRQTDTELRQQYLRELLQAHTQTAENKSSAGLTDQELDHLVARSPEDRAILSALCTGTDALLFMEDSAAEAGSSEHVSTGSASRNAADSRLAPKQEVSELIAAALEAAAPVVEESPSKLGRGKRRRTVESYTEPIQ